MKCSEVQDLMAAFVTRDLPTTKAEAVRRHIKTCEECRLWHQEVLGLADVWMEDVQVSGLNLVDAVLSRLEVADRSPELGDSGVAPRWNVPSRITLVHYGLAASIALALFQFGVFARLGATLMQNGLVLSDRIYSLMHFLSNM
ncbi:zf-HC2 domain-containing protein [Alicyclobacillus shizuokensis]|uniref:zf-HC2 domain-containing protein n=1 Tax=Alicyclobacillus shizuokensis TaxID=392014 RepID=UPI00082E8492|nr:zf-HC2 domain-containing protein [Alicyclobacillus shizuokensis]MCL6625889.1 zf-HC2 domain-containing protein [Alicyclobacillus shizuokensis]